MGLTMRLAKDRDKTEVLSLLNSVFSENQRTASLRDEAYWKWKFFNGPFGPSMLMVAELDGMIVGVNNWWPWEFIVRGQVVKALQPCDSAVHQDYRGQGCFKQLRIFGLKAAQEKGVRLLFNYPNENSLPAYLSLGWHFQKHIPWRIRVLKPLSLVKGLFSGAKSESLTIDAIYRIDVKVLDEMSKRTDGFDQFLKINRVPGFHEWRYLNHPHRSYGMITYARGHKKTAAVFTINNKGQNLEMVVVDMLGAVENTLPLFRRIVDAGRQMNVGFIAVMDNMLFNTSALWRLGFVKRCYKNMVVLPLDLTLESHVKGYDNWSLMAGMHDSI
jgi:GNAT superfamily N-acetyltransferase